MRTVLVLVSAREKNWSHLSVREILQYDKIWGGAICISVPLQNSGGTRPPSPVIYAHA